MYGVDQPEGACELSVIAKTRNNRGRAQPVHLDLLRALVQSVRGNIDQCYQGNHSEKDCSDPEVPAPTNMVSTKTTYKYARENPMREKVPYRQKTRFFRGPGR